MYSHKKKRKKNKEAITLVEIEIFAFGIEKSRWVSISMLENCQYNKKFHMEKVKYDQRDFRNFQLFTRNVPVDN